MQSHTPSLLDKLLDADASGRSGVSMRYSVEQVKDSVARDIEMLLNAHAAYEASDLASSPLAARSLLTLGLIDISTLSLASPKDRLRINEAIRTALTTHDKRLFHVEVALRQSDGPNSKITFSIRAKLMLRPLSEPVVFDAVLQPGSKRYEVAKSDHRGVAIA